MYNTSIAREPADCVLLVSASPNLITHGVAHVALAAAIYLFLYPVIAMTYEIEASLDRCSA
jgi:hypothetical protein